MVLIPGKSEQKLVSKALFSAVVPRPIAWITTLSSSGVVNLAPFSFFNGITSKPPILMVSIGKRKDGTLKDTDKNIRESKEFVVNIVGGEFLEKVHLSGKDYPPNVSEAKVLGVELLPSKVVSVPRVKGALASFECKLKKVVEIGDTPMSVIFGEVVTIHIKEELFESSVGVLGRLGGKRYLIVKDEISFEEK